jgi:hypothetical protein
MKYFIQSHVQVVARVLTGMSFTSVKALLVFFFNRTIITAFSHNRDGIRLVRKKILKFTQTIWTIFAVFEQQNWSNRL